ncbi:MAG: hypothetical protein J6C87_05375, partial [Bacteroides sp.]|nr:hypothetical protein [Bacteroides sp.]
INLPRPLGTPPPAPPLSGESNLVEGDFRYSAPHFRYSASQQRYHRAATPLPWEGSGEGPHHRAAQIVNCKL